MHVYESSKSAGLQAAGFLMGGALVFALILLMMFLDLTARPGATNNTLPGMAGGIGVAGVFMIARGLSLLRNVRRVVIDESCVRADGYISSTLIRWEQIRAVAKETKHGLYGNTTTFLVLADAQEKPLLLIPDYIHPFEALAAEIESRSAVRASAGAGAAVAQRIQQRSGRGKRWFNVAFSAVFCLAMGAGLIFSGNEAIHDHRYASAGAAADAHIDRLYMNSVTPWIAYSFRDDAGRSFSRETSIEQSQWKALSLADSVRIEYLRDDPSWNRLVGEEPTAGMSMVLICGFGLLFFGAFFVMSAMGIDIRSEDGKLKVVRYGQSIATPAAAAIEAPHPVPAAAIIASIPPLRRHQPKVAIPPTRPSGLIVLGSVAVVVAVIGVLRNGLNLAIFFAGSFTIANQTLVADTTPLRGAWCAFDLLLVIALAAVGVGLILLRRSARQWAMAVALLQLASSAGAIVMIIMMAIDLPALPGEEGVRQRTMIMGAILGALIGAIFPLILLLICARRSTARALEENGAAAAPQEATST